MEGMVSTVVNRRHYTSRHVNFSGVLKLVKCPDDDTRAPEKSAIASLPQAVPNSLLLRRPGQVRFVKSSSSVFWGHYALRRDFTNHTCRLARSLSLAPGPAGGLRFAR